MGGSTKSLPLFIDGDSRRIHGLRSSNHCRAIDGSGSGLMNVGLLSRLSFSSSNDLGRRSPPARFSLLLSALAVRSVGMDRPSVDSIDSDRPSSARLSGDT